LADKFKEMSPLVLAYLGDAVFELCVREFLTAKRNLTPNEMNEYAHTLVNAASQAGMYHKVFEILSDEERAVIKRGRNAKNSSVPKNAAVSDYRHATGLESLFGYLHMAGRGGRIRELFAFCVKGQQEDGKYE